MCPFCHQALKRVVRMSAMVKAGEPLDALGDVIQNRRESAPILLPPEKYPEKCGDWQLCAESRRKPRSGCLHPHAEDRQNVKPVFGHNGRSLFQEGREAREELREAYESTRRWLAGGRGKGARSRPIANTVQPTLPT